ncbi:hypothetical protein [Nocardia blacklockiae]|uniref:hypothetical protein n=1 Tax=Nocardia blacklockiae TaxID=480036 RepID=UPI0018953733|nr:hypothetical protein [Nocardia blacklockiae]MBF6173437.1 hypothetical protein [Nocardia blacklockiae]
MSNPYGGQPPNGHHPWQQNGQQPYPGVPQPQNGAGAYGAPQPHSTSAPQLPQQPHSASSPQLPQPGHGAAQPNSASSPHLQQPGYGAPQPNSASSPHLQQPGYGAPQPNSAYPQPGYGAGQPNSASSPQFPQPGYGAAQPNNLASPQPGAPQQYGGSYPHPGYGAPQQPGYPPQPYGAPAGYGAPGQPFPANPYGGQPNPYGAANYGAPQGQYPAPGQQPFQPEPGPPGIVVDSSYFPMAFLLALTGPKILVNGQQVPGARWGATHIPIGPGQHHVRVATRWMFDMGPADAVVPVAEGMSTRVYYRSPAIAFIRGAIGPVPQSTPGIVFIYVMWAFVALIILLNIVLIAAM